MPKAILQQAGAQSYARFLGGIKPAIRWLACSRQPKCSATLRRYSIENVSKEAVVP